MELTINIDKQSPVWQAAFERLCAEPISQLIKIYTNERGELKVGVFVPELGRTVCTEADTPEDVIQRIEIKLQEMLEQILLEQLGV